MWENVKLSMNESERDREGEKWSLTKKKRV